MPYSRADALKLGAAGAGLGLLGALPTGAQAAGETISGTLSITWYHSGDPLTKRLYKQYMARRPMVKIAEIPEPGGDYAAERAWLATRILAGRMPDIFEPGTVSLVLDGVAKARAA
jgi:ABC-type glycerol-3-phosphate transport system substrate-binding protein